MQKIKWLFFDMGGTLVDETLSYIRWFENAAELSCGMLTAEQIEKEYCAGMREGMPTVSGQLKACGVEGVDTSLLYPSELDRPYPEAESVLKKLSVSYRLGIIANQNAGSEERLRTYGLLHYFDIITASAESGLKKPDPRIFMLALREAGCSACEAVMIGDRVDNDIRPAKALNFTTVRILQGYGALQPSEVPEDMPDFTITSLQQLLDIF